VLPGGAGTRSEAQLAVRYAKPVVAFLGSGALPAGWPAIPVAVTLEELARLLRPALEEARRRRAESDQQHGPYGLPGPVEGDPPALERHGVCRGLRVGPDGARRAHGEAGPQDRGQRHAGRVQQPNDDAVALLGRLERREDQPRRLEREQRLARRKQRLGTGEERPEADLRVAGGDRIDAAHECE